jgi:hypothetical protein
MLITGSDMRETSKISKGGKAKNRKRRGQRCPRWTSGFSRNYSAGGDEINAKT